MLTAALGGLDAFVFTAGIGENSATIRARIAERLTWLGAIIDPALNTQARTIDIAPREPRRPLCDADRRRTDDCSAYISALRDRTGHGAGESYMAIPVRQSRAASRVARGLIVGITATSRSPGAAPRRSAPSAPSLPSPISTTRPRNTSSRWHTNCMEAPIVCRSMCARGPANGGGFRGHRQTRWGHLGFRRRIAFDFSQRKTLRGARRRRVA